MDLTKKIFSHSQNEHPCPSRTVHNESFLRSTSLLPSIHLLRHPIGPVERPVERGLALSSRRANSEILLFRAISRNYTVLYESSTGRGGAGKATHIEGSDFPLLFPPPPATHFCFSSCFCSCALGCVCVCFHDTTLCARGRE